MFRRRHRQRPRPPRPPNLPAPPPEEVFLGDAATPFRANELARKRRNDAAASLVDDETFGYVLLRLSKKKQEKTGKIDIAAHIEPEWRPAFKVLLEKVMEHGF